MSNEQINHPQHYGGEDNPFKPIKIIEGLKIGFHLGNTLKYMLRAGKKDPSKKIEDLKKARWYLDRYIEVLEREEVDKRLQIEKYAKEEASKQC